MNGPRGLLAAALAAALGCGAGAGPPGSGEGCIPGSPGARWIAFSSSRAGGDTLFAMRSDGSCTTQVGSGAGGELFATASPRGEVAFMSRRSGAMQVYVRDLATGAERRLDVGALEATQPAFSPDGARLAFEGYSPGVTAESDVWVVPAAGGAPVNLTGGGARSGGPAWSPDGTQVYFVSNRGGRYDVWRVPAAGGEAVAVTDASRILGRPAASPDGSAIAYARLATAGAFSEVVLQDLATGAIRVVSSQLDGEPAFDRGGAQLVVTSHRTGNPELFLLDAATGEVIRQLTRDPAVDGGGCFVPSP